MNKTFKKSLISFLSLTLLTGCGAQQGKQKWSYTREDSKLFDVFEASVKENEEGDKYIFSVLTDENTFNDKLNDENILFFNKTLLDLTSTDTYYSYDEISKNLVSFDNFDLNQNGSGFTIEFNGNDRNNYAVLINKEATIGGQFAYAQYIAPGNFTSEQQKIQTEFEEELISTRPSYDDLKVLVDIGGYIAQIIIGSQTGVPTAMASGITGLVNCLGPTFFGSNSPTIADVLSKLEVIESKLDELSSKIDQNQKQLMDEFVRTQAMINEVLINQYKADTTAFVTDYVDPIDDYLVTYKDYVEQSFKALASTQYEIKFAYEKNDQGKDELRSVIDRPDLRQLSLTLVRRENMQKYLQDHHNIVGEGFADAVIADIKSNILTMTVYPIEKTKNELAEDLYTTIVNDFQYKRFSDPNNHNEILQFMNNVRKFSDRLTGYNSLTSAVDTYVSRLRLIFNFSGEARSTLDSMLATLRLRLDNYFNIAQTACLYAEINPKDMIDAYFRAADKIQETLDGEIALGDNYCYYTKNTVYGNFFKSYWDISYTNLGNHPTFHSSFKTEVVKNFYNTYISSQEVDIQGIGMIGQTDHTRIMTRYTMLKGLELTSAATYIDYLTEAKIMQNNAKQIQTSMKAKGWVGNDSNRFLTSFEIKNMTDDHKYISVECTDKGNANCYYFYKGERVNYKDASKDREEEYWSGKIATGTFLNADDATLSNDKKIACYAQYHESHLLWIVDEIFGFVDNPSGCFYYMLHSQAIK